MQANMLFNDILWIKRKICKENVIFLQKKIYYSALKAKKFDF